MQSYHTKSAVAHLSKRAGYTPFQRSGRLFVKVCSHQSHQQGHLSCPYSVLGLSPDAQEPEIKASYRKLAKKYHPDISKDENSTHQFVNISEAYEYLLQTLRQRGSVDADGNVKPGNSDAFHDWYWSFKMSRNWNRQRAKDGDAGDESSAGPASHTSTPQSVEGLKSQLAGLRHRAAIRRNRPGKSETTSDDEAQDSTQHANTAHALSDEEHEALFVAAEGPSDSADARVAMSTPPAAHANEDCSHSQSYSAYRKKFVASSDSREGLKSQLHGMRRKASLRQRS